MEQTPGPQDRKTRVVILTGRRQEYQSLVDKREGFDRKLAQNHPFYTHESAMSEVLITHTGIGPEKVQETLNDMNQLLEPDLLIVAGTSGSLVEDLNFGELFVPTAVTDGDGDRWAYPETELVQWFLGFQSEALEEELIRSGPLASVRDPVVERNERSKLKETTQAMAVDMETYEIARWYENQDKENSVGWMALKIVSDDVEDNSDRDVKNQQSEAIEQLEPYLESLLNELQ